MQLGRRHSLNSPHSLVFSLRLPSLESRPVEIKGRLEEILSSKKKEDSIVIYAQTSSLIHGEDWESAKGRDHSYSSPSIHTRNPSRISTVMCNVSQHFSISFCLTGKREGGRERRSRISSFRILTSVTAFPFRRSWRNVIEKREVCSERWMMTWTLGMKEDSERFQNRSIWRKYAIRRYTDLDTLSRYRRESTNLNTSETIPFPPFESPFFFFFLVSSFPLSYSESYYLQIIFRTFSITVRSRWKYTRVTNPSLHSSCHSTLNEEADSSWQP